MSNNTETYTKTFSIDLERANYHLKCKKRRRKRILIVTFIWLFVFVYIFTPLSKVNLKVYGNVYYTKKDLMNITYMSEKDYWWLFNTKNAKKVLESYEYIESVEYSKSVLGIKLKVKEIYPLGVKDNKYVMSNRAIIEKEEYDLNGRVINLVDFNDIGEEDLNYLIDKYKNIKLNVRNHFNYLEIIKTELATNEYYRYVKLYGNDDRIGNFVIKVDLVYLDTKFNENKYDKIIEEVSKNNVKYGEKPALIAYHDIDEEKFQLVDDFKEE